MREIQNILIALLMMLLLTACGSEDDKDDIKTITGQFIDSPVEGLSYTCSSAQTGITNNNGEYTCNVGDTVSFSLGSISLGEVKATDVITPFALFPSDEEAAINFAQLIQTLDSDGDPSNGIKINEEILATLNTVDFSSSSFDEDIQVSLGNNIVLIDATQAQKHLNESFASLNLNSDGTPNEEETTTNFTPTANAGVDQNVNTTSTVTLDGSTSSDADGNTLTYLWNITSAPTGSNATLTNATTVNPTFVADIDGSYVLSLVVNDETANSTADTITVTASTANSAPVANAGVDQNVATTSTVTLDGLTSSDADLDTLTYSWILTSKPIGSNATLTNPTTVDPIFISDLDGSYVLSLVVNDGTVNSTTDTVTITSTTVINLSASIPGTTRYFLNEFGNTGHRVYGTNNGYTYAIGNESGSGTYAISGNRMTLNRDTGAILVFTVIGFTTDKKGIDFSLSVNSGDAFRTYNYINQEDRDAASY